MSDYDPKLLDAYGVQTWKELMGEEAESSLWFPLYTCTGDWTDDMDYGQAKKNMEQVKRMWLPKVIMASEKEFEDIWAEYMHVYREKVDVKAYENELNQEIQRRIRDAGFPSSGNEDND